MINVINSLVDVTSDVLVLVVVEIRDGWQH